MTKMMEEFTTFVWFPNSVEMMESHISRTQVMVLNFQRQSRYSHYNGLHEKLRLWWRDGGQHGLSNGFPFTNTGLATATAVPNLPRAEANTEFPVWRSIGHLLAVRLFT